MDELFKTYTAFCKDENGNLIKIENIHSPDREEGMLYVKEFNRNFRIVSMLTDEDLKQLKEVLNESD